MVDITKFLEKLAILFITKFMFAPLRVTARFSPSTFSRSMYFFTPATPSAPAGSAMERVYNLFRAALESGGEDNITIIWIEMEPGTLSNEWLGKEVEPKTREDEHAEIEFRTDGPVVF